MLAAALLLLPHAGSYVVDSGAKNRTFDGVGALSGGGATTKLLPSYKPAEREAILDVLFKPQHLASLQLLKIEIGGDADSTEGSEASHEHTAGHVNCNRGYEFWLAKQAKARNPAIRLYGLPWGWPGWLGGANHSAPLAPWNAEATAGYIADWVDCAKSAHNLTIDFIGPWNELDKVSGTHHAALEPVLHVLWLTIWRHKQPFADYGIGYLKTLRRVLNGRGLQHTKLVGGDVHTWVDPLCDALNGKADSELTAAVAVIGKHYPSTISSAKAKQTGLPLWASEDFASDNHGTGGRCEARILNQNWSALPSLLMFRLFSCSVSSHTPPPTHPSAVSTCLSGCRLCRVGGMMTATIAWNLVSSYYSWLALANDGLMTARTPWCAGSDCVGGVTVGACVGSGRWGSSLNSCRGRTFQVGQLLDRPSDLLRGPHLAVRCRRVLAADRRQGFGLPRRRWKLRVLPRRGHRG